MNAAGFLLGGLRLLFSQNVYLRSMIPPKTVQEIIEAARIEEVVEEFVSLRRRGINLIGLCPFHGEKSPSFNVNPAKNIFKCFGCGKAGDAITFLREHENLNFDEALRWLARKYRIDIQEVERSPEQMAEQQLNESLFIVNDFAAKHFLEQLFETDEGKSVALSYFKKRGLREETIRKFGLGYAPDERDLLLKTARHQGYAVDLLKQTGLCSPDATRDFFRARVMFSIHNLSGKVAAFAGRTMSSDKTVPKYVNSPETVIYVKNKILYGAYQAKSAIRKHDECILVEGYMDVISLHQAGIENVVASSGTSLTEGQLQLIKRNTQNLTILYDGDSAGIKAALRGLDLALEQDLNVRIALLPDGHDPDSYVQEFGLDVLREFIQKQGKDFILFKTSILLADTQGDPIKKATLIRDIVNSISKIPDPIKRSVYLKECAALLNVDENALVTETNKNITGAMRKKAEKDERAAGPVSDMPYGGFDHGFPSAEPMLDALPERAAAQAQNAARNASLQEREIISLLIQFGDKTLSDGEMLATFLLSDIEDSLTSFDHPLYGKIAVECHQLLQAGQTFDTNHFLRHDDEAIRMLAIDMLTAPDDYSHNWVEKVGLPLQNQPMPDMNYEAGMRYAVDMFKINKLRKMCDVVNPARIREAAESKDNELVMYYLSVQKKIKETLNTLAQKRNIVVFS